MTRTCSLVLVALVALVSASAVAAAPTCAQLHAQLVKMDAERQKARNKGDAADVAKITAIIASIKAQQLAAGCP